jgi:hypothetical protein
MRAARRTILLVTAILGLATLGAPGVMAQTTSASFTLTGGSLAVSVPATASLGSHATGTGVITGNLGAVTVTDGRGAVTAVWTASVSSTDFTTGAGGAGQTVSKSQVGYASGAATATSGTGAFAPGTAASLAVPGVAGAWAGGLGNNSATWNPTITVTLLGGEVAGTYAGTITHSVA